MSLGGGSGDWLKLGSEKESLLPLGKKILKKSVTRNMYNGNIKMKRAGQESK